MKRNEHIKLLNKSTNAELYDFLHFCLVKFFDEYDSAMVWQTKCRFHLKNNLAIQQHRKACGGTYLVGVGAEEQKVKGHSCHQVDQKPPFEIVDGDFARIGDDLVVSGHVSRPKIDENVNDEGHVNWKGHTFFSSCFIYGKM